MFLEIIKSIILGIVQGVTEFFPVSSSGHLVIIPFVFRWDYIPVYYAVILHFATLLSLVTIFYREIGRIIKSFFTGIFKKEARAGNYYFKLSLLIIIASVPAAIAGFFLQDFVDKFFKDIFYVAIFLIITALFLFLGEFIGKRSEKKGRNFNFFIAFITGIGQAIAILPGISRSGTTISFSRSFGIKREECVKFSMFLSAPVILGAFILETTKYLHLQLPQNAQINLNMAVSFIFAYLSGLFAIKFLLRYSRNRNLNYFAFYCLGLAILVLVIYFVFHK